MAALSAAGPLPLRASVVVPAYNAGADLGRVLESIEASVGQCAIRGRLGPERFAIVVVDDASTDDTGEVARDFIARSPVPGLYLRQPQNRGAGPARNRGAAAVEASHLFFCDADDGFLPDHLPVCLGAMERRPDLAAVATSLALSDPVHPDWHVLMDDTAVTVLCVRSLAHLLCGGFDEHPAFRVTGGEDAWYRQRLASVFRIGKIASRTVPYRRRPGNNYDKQLARFQQHPGAGIDAVTPEQQALLPLIRTLQHDRLARLRASMDELRAMMAAPSQEKSA